MNQWELSFAIAKKIGWTFRKPKLWECILFFWPKWIAISPEGVEYCNHCPKFGFDLNEMHDAENWLRQEKPRTMWVDYEFSIAKCSPAEERAKAFLSATHQKTLDISIKSN